MLEDKSLTNSLANNQIRSPLMHKNNTKKHTTSPSFQATTMRKDDITLVVEAAEDVENGDDTTHFNQ